jgi:hypothetical protein
MDEFEEGGCLDPFDVLSDFVEVAGAKMVVDLD